MKILFDLDDTLIHTHRMFIEEITHVAQLISNKTKVNIDEIVKYIYEVIADSYAIAKVNPKITWPLTFSKLQAKYNLTDSEKNHHMNIMLNIYNRKPDLKDGAIELLEKCKSEKVELGLVTHASKKWTNYKLKSVGIKKYFKHIQIVDTNRSKNSQDWLKALEELGGNLKETWIVGDNIKGDIQAGYEVGFRKLIWIDKEDGWEMYRTGELPKNTITAKNLFEVSQILFTS